MHRSLSRFVVVGFFALILNVTSVPSVQALSLAPTILDVQANPGETKTVVVTLTNDEAEPVQIESSIQKFIPLGMNGQQQFLSPADMSGLPSWTYVGAIAGGLKPGERQNVSVQIRVPADAPLGGAYQAVFFSAQPLIQKPGMNVGLRSKIGALVLLTVGDTTQTELILSDWRILNEEGAAASLSGTVRLTLKNRGRAHIVPQGELVVRNMFGGVVTRLPINAQKARILPASQRTFDLPFGSAGAFGMGRYRISLEGIQGLSEPSPLLLTVLPWRVMGAVLIAVFLLIIGFRLYRRYLIRALHAQHL